MNLGADLHGKTRVVTAAERAAVERVLGLSGLTRGEVTVVFAYPGLGVGRRHEQLSGCANQTLLLETAVGQLERLGIAVIAASTEAPDKHAHLPELARVFVRFTDDDAALVPHLDLDDGRHLLRWTLILGGPRDGQIVTDITDSVAHTRAVIDMLANGRSDA